MATLKAVYLGNTEGEYYGFTVGRNYDVLHYGNDNIWVVDDDFCQRNIKNGAFHKFDITDENQKDNAKNFGGEKEDSLSSIHKNHGEMKYRMNGAKVTKQFFEEKILEVELLKSRGASVFIDFEVYFE